jgi:hypothetical protein
VYFYAEVANDYSDCRVGRGPFQERDGVDIHQGGRPRAAVDACEDPLRDAALSSRSFEWEVSNVAFVGWTGGRYWALFRLELTRSSDRHTLRLGDDESASIPYECDDVSCGLDVRARVREPVIQRGTPRFRIELQPADSPGPLHEVDYFSQRRTMRYEQLPRGSYELVVELVNFSHVFPSESRETAVEVKLDGPWNVREPRTYYLVMDMEGRRRPYTDCRTADTFPRMTEERERKLKTAPLTELQAVNEACGEIVRRAATTQGEQVHYIRNLGWYLPVQGEYWAAYEVRVAKRLH